jgi:hypothetical protein
MNLIDRRLESLRAQRVKELTIAAHLGPMEQCVEGVCRMCHCEFVPQPKRRPDVCTGCLKGAEHLPRIAVPDGKSTKPESTVRVTA